MTVKNADMPAMPQSATDNGYGCNYDNDFNGQVPTGLTKREIFALNAPDIPAWFIDDWLYNNGDYRLGGIHELVGNNRGANLDTKEMMKITKEWRYAYADLMLGE